MDTIKNRTAYTQALIPDGTLILQGTTKTCPQCKAISPFLTQLMKKYPDARFYTYDVDEAADIAQELGSNQVPHFTVFKDGMKDDAVTGAKPRELERKIGEVYEGKVDEDVDLDY